MDGQDGVGSRLQGDDPTKPRRLWHYEGVGLWQSFAKPQFWMLATNAIVALTIYGYIVIGPRGRIEPGRTELHKTDFTVFTEAGAAFFDGRDPYRVTNPRGWHYLYPPLFALIVAPLSVLDTESQVVIWYAVNVALSFGCFGEARRLWRLLSLRAGTSWAPWIVTCGALTAFLPFFDCMQAGQLGIAILYLLVLGFRVVLEGRSWARGFLAGLVLALPAVVKLLPALPVLGLLVHQWAAVAFPDRERRPWGRVTGLTTGVSVGALLFLLAIPASLIGWQKNLGYLDVWRTGIVANQRVGETANFNFRSARNQSLANAVYLSTTSTSRAIAPKARATARRDRHDRMVHPGVRVAVGGAFALLLALGLVLGRRKSALDQTVAYSLALCATLVVSPLAWGHYYMAEVPAVLCVPLWLWRCGMLTAARVVAAIPPILSWSHYVAMPYTGEVGLLGLGTAAWFIGVCGFILGIEVSAAIAPSPPGRRSDPGRPGVHRAHGAHGRHRHTGRRAASPDSASSHNASAP